MDTLAINDNYEPGIDIFERFRNFTNCESVEELFEELYPTDLSQFEDSDIESLLHLRFLDLMKIERGVELLREEIFDIFCDERPFKALVDLILTGNTDGFFSVMRGELKERFYDETGACESIEGRYNQFCANRNAEIEEDLNAINDADVEKMLDDVQRAKDMNAA